MDWALGSGIVKEVEHEHMARRIVMYCTYNRHAYLAKQVQKTKPTNIVEEKDDAARCGPPAPVVRSS